MAKCQWWHLDSWIHSFWENVCRTLSVLEGSDSFQHHGQRLQLGSLQKETTWQQKPGDEMFSSSADKSAAAHSVTLVARRTVNLLPRLQWSSCGCTISRWTTLGNVLEGWGLQWALEQGRGCSVPQLGFVVQLTTVNCKHCSSHWIYYDWRDVNTFTLLASWLNGFTAPFGGFMVAAETCCHNVTKQGSNLINWNKIKSLFATCDL